MPWLVLLALLLGWASNYLQRAALNPWMPAMSRDAAFSGSQLSFVFSALTLGLIAGYVLLTMVTGLAGTRWGLLVSLVGASLAAAATGVADSFPTLVAARFVLGFFSGGLLPACLQALREWFPPPMRPLVIGMFFAAGQAAGLLLPLWSLASGNGSAPRSVLSLTAVPTLLAAVLCFMAWQSAPVPEPQEKASSVGTTSVAMLAAGLFLASPVSTFTVSWAAMYLRQHAQFTTERVASMSMAAALGGAAGAVLAGVCAWGMLQNGAAAWKVRAQLLPAFGGLLPVVALIAFVTQLEVAMAVSVLVSVAYHGFAVLLYWAVADTLPARGVAVGAAIGALVTAVNSLVAPSVFGYFAYSSAGYPLLFAALALSGAMAALIVGLLAWFVRPQPAV